MCAVSVSLGTGRLTEHPTRSALSNALARILFPHTHATADICVVANEEM